MQSPAESSLRPIRSSSPPTFPYDKGNAASEFGAAATVYPIDTLGIGLLMMLLMLGAFPVLLLVSVLLLARLERGLQGADDTEIGGRHRKSTGQKRRGADTDDGQPGGAERATAS